MAQPEKSSDRANNDVIRSSESVPTVGGGTPTGGVQISVKRDGCMVQVSLTSGSEYLSIELYDNLVQSMKKGALRLDIGLHTGAM